MKDWIMEVCPEIAEWQAELIAEQVQAKVAAEREACAVIVSPCCKDCAKEIRARGEK